MASIGRDELLSKETAPSYGSAGDDASPDLEHRKPKTYYTCRLDHFVSGAYCAVETVKEKAENIAGKFAAFSGLLSFVFTKAKNETQDRVKNALEAHEDDEDECWVERAEKYSVLPEVHSHVTSGPSDNFSIPSLSDVGATKNTDLENPEALKQDSLYVSSIRIPLMAYAVLATAVVSLSCLAPLLDLQQDATPSMKLFWRMIGTTILLTPLAVKDMFACGLPLLSKQEWLMFLVSTISYDVCCLAFVIALDYTTVADVVILSNTHPLLMLVGKLFLGDAATSVEASGALIAFFGAFLCSKDSYHASGGGGSMSIFGDLIGITSAAGNAGYTVLAKEIRQHMTLYVFIWLTMGVGSILILVYQMSTGETVTIGMDRETGLFGFLNLQEDRLPVELALVVVCNIFGAMGYVRAMKHFDSLAISTSTLMEPVTAEVLAVFLGVSALPGWKGLFGNVLVAVGTFLVIYRADKKGKGHA